MIHNFRWFEEGVMAGCRVPAFTNEIDWLFKQGVRAILSLHPLEPDIRSEILKREFDYRTCYLDDYGIPNDEDLKIILDFYDAMKKAQKPLLIHCGAGCGRTGTIGAAILIRNGQSPEKALQKVWGVETKAQEDFLFHLAKKLHK